MKIKLFLSLHYFASKIGSSRSFGDIFFVHTSQATPFLLVFGRSDLVYTTSIKKMFDAIESNNLRFAFKSVILKSEIIVGFNSTEHFLIQVVQTKSD